MNKPGLFSNWTLRAAVVALLAAALLCLSAGLSTPDPAVAQPRPTLTPTTSSTQPGPTALPSAAPCESICGQVINLENNGGEPAQSVRFSGAGWSVETTSDGNGNYAYGRLGTEVGLLNLVVPEGSDLHPVTTDIAIAPVPGWPIVVNLGAYRTSWRGPLLVPTAWASPSWVRPGGQVTFTVRVENRLPTKISGVMVTDLLPGGLALIGVTSDRGDTSRAGNYGAAFIGDLGPGETATVLLIADVDDDAPSGTVRNRVSLIYREHAAGQAVASVTVGWTPPATPTSEAEGRTTASATPASTPTPGTLPVTGPSFLPVTGYGLTAVGVGLAFGATALLARHIRQRRKEPPREEE